VVNTYTHAVRHHQHARNAGSRQERPQHSRPFCEACRSTQTRPRSRRLTGRPGPVPDPASVSKRPAGSSTGSREQPSPGPAANDCATEQKGGSVSATRWVARDDPRHHGYRQGISCNPARAIDASRSGVRCLPSVCVGLGVGVSIAAVPHSCARVDGERVAAARGEGHARLEPRPHGEIFHRHGVREARVLSSARPLDGS
jgi:hypothetical protein